MSKVVQWAPCPCGAKRGFASEALAEKALGRAKAKRNRARGYSGACRRGLERENRFYECPEGAWHLTKRSRRSFLGQPAGVQIEYNFERGAV